MAQRVEELAEELRENPLVDQYVRAICSALLTKWKKENTAKDKEWLERIDSYIETINRMGPDIAMVDASAFYASAAISLKRIADAAEKIVEVLTTPPLMMVPPNADYCVVCDREYMTKNNAMALCDLPDCRRKGR